MNTIHDDRMGSEAARMRAALNRERRARMLLGRAKDGLEVILGAGCVGFCRILAARRRLIANVHFRAQFGWPPDAVLERGDLDARVHEEDRAGLAGAIDAALAQGTPLNLTVRAVWPCGKTQYIALRGRSALADDPTDVRRRSADEFVLVATNVTPEHQAMQEARAAARQESELRASALALSRANLQLLADVSHALRSPLNSMLGWNRILALKRATDPEIKAITERVTDGARAQLRIVNDLLDLGRMGVGEFKIDPRPMKLARAAANAIEGVSAGAQAKAIEITADFAATAGEMQGDAERLRQVVAHLLSNAIKFTPDGGRIRVWLRRDGTDLELGVADTGRGIAPELLSYVFDRAQRSDSPGGCRGAGLGLGLSLAREIVTLHGGTVRVASDGVDRGTTVTVRLPGRAAADSAAEPAAPVLMLGTPRLRGLGILVVDDEPDARTVVAELLKTEGAEVSVCDSAASAYEKLSAKDASFEVVVTDIGMPVEDGYSLVRKLRALQSGKRVLAIALTGRASTHDVAAALEAGFDLHVAKPVDLERFVSMIRRLSPHRVAPVAAPSQLEHRP